MIAPTRLPLRGAVNLVDRGVATSQNYVYRMPPLRLSGTSPQGLVRLPLRGAVSIADCGVAFGTSRCRSLRSPTASDSLSHTKKQYKRDELKCLKTVG